MTNVAHRLYLLVLVTVVGFGAARQANADPIVVEGTEAFVQGSDVNLFISLLNQFSRYSPPGAIQWEVSSIPGQIGRRIDFGLLPVTSSQFARTLVGQIVSPDAPFPTPVRLQVGQGQGGVLIGSIAMSPSEPQRIDLDDLAMFVSSNPRIPAPESLLIHEIAERSRLALGFSNTVAHSIAIDQQNLVNLDAGKVGIRLHELDLEIPVFDGPFVTRKDVFIPFIDTTTGSRYWVQIRYTTPDGEILSADLTYIMEGLISTGLPYAGTDFNIVIESISVVDALPPGVEVVPEPFTLTLLSLGTLGLVGYGWRRRKRPTAA